MRSRGSAAEDMRRLQIGLSTLAMIIFLVYISHAFQQQVAQDDPQNEGDMQVATSPVAAISSE